MTAQFYLSAARKSSGKTTLSIGISAALKRKGLIIQPFKKGPDYIDPIWLSKAAGLPTYNLDFNTQSKEEILSTYARYSPNADIRVVEGNKGLFDGVALDGSNSNVALAKLLGLPVVLVIKCEGISRGIAPMLLGYQEFDPEINYAGVILNMVGSSRHEAKLIQATEHYTDFKVIGSVRTNPELEIPERHLGLIPANESNEADKVIEHLSNTVADSVDLDTLITNTSLNFKPDVSKHSNTHSNPPIRIGIARDSAFGFYYPDDLLAMEDEGAELVFFDTINDSSIPEVDALFIGGGFPETHMDSLSANTSMTTSIANAIEAGMPTYAECGGMMYLCESIKWQNNQRPMAGVLPATIEMHTKPQGRGLTLVKETNHMPWQTIGETRIRSHEFHYAQMNLNKPVKFAYSVHRGYGINGNADGVIHRNLLASFIHLRNTESNPWVKRFMEFVRQKVLS